MGKEGSERDGGWDEVGWDGVGGRQSKAVGV